MDTPHTAVITDRNGARGTIESLPDAQAGPDTQVTVRLDSGQRVVVPFSLLTRRSDDTYFVAFTLAEFLTSAGHGSAQMGTFAGTDASAVREEGDHMVVPIVEEQLAVGKRVVETGGVRINKIVEERQETVDVPLFEDRAEVERVAINRMVDSAPAVRREGDVTILPVLEEVLVVEKRLMLREELHIRLRREETRKPQQVTLRREDVQIEQFAPGESFAESAGAVETDSARQS